MNSPGSERERVSSALPTRQPEPVAAKPASGPPVIEIKNLVKQYGSIEALKGASLTVQRGEIFGLLGQNGAGKTTMVKVLLGIISASFGEAYMLGEPAGTAHIRKRVGYLPEDHRFPDYHSAVSLLDFYGSLLEIPKNEKKARMDEMIEFVGLTKRKTSKIRTYSKGMKQRLGIAQAIFHNPDVIFLDEPTDGVDPVGRKQIRELLLELKNEGKTIFINSHLLGEVELISDRVIILHKGEIIRQGTMDELTKQRGLFLVGLAPGQIFPKKEAADAGYMVSRRGELWEVGLIEGQTIDALVDLLRSLSLNLRHLEEKHQTLEDIFLETVEAVEPVHEAPRRRKRYDN